MGKHKAPPAPDYTAAAQAQGVANLAAGQQTAALNRPDQIGPNGSQTWALRDGADPKNPQPGDWVVTNKLDDTQQALKDQQDQLSASYGTQAQQALGDVNNHPTTGINYDGLWDFGKTPDIAQHQLAPTVDQNRSVLSTNGLSNFGHVDPTTEASRQRITDALYSRNTAMLDPQTHQQTSDLTSRLAAQGITEGSDAYKRATDNLSRQQADAYANARNDSILAGGNEDSRITNQNLGVAGFQNSTRGQEFNERGQVVSSENGNRDSIFNQGLAAAGFNNNSADQLFSQGMAKVGQDNATRNQQLGEKTTIGGFNNNLHNNSVAEALALRSGLQPGQLNFQSYGGAGQVGAAPVYDAATQAYQAALAANNANNANTSSIWGGLGKIGSTAASIFLG